MKRITLTLPLLLALASSPLYADPGHHHDGDSMVVKARVTNVEPIIEVIEVPHQRRDCWEEEVSGHTHHHNGGGMLAGAIIGGVIGHNIGDRRHRGLTTAMGTAIGATIGRQHDQDYTTPYSTTEQHCRIGTDYSQEERIVGYRVRYRYHGEEYTTRLGYEPGKFVRLRVTHQLLD